MVPASAVQPEGPAVALRASPIRAALKVGTAPVRQVRRSPLSEAQEPV
eukprot:CAMPEP_0179109468 /NCGR_PEP_ID=MMETSP0796-20121207/51042_1 /TAXON_ID=73915 /ORGANISM="Pyrodinium bahamense, Strain pbaha01" /LENGTH=47 /DNA_ID= /DNA_START= /DNA_END= /DNA_ORIENTATION=